MTSPPSSGGVCPQLVLLDGATGSGKSSLLRHLRDEYSSSVFVGKKFTTRQQRIGDNTWEFRFVERIPERYSECSFESVGNRYAVNCDEVKQAIDRGLIYAITCVDRPTIETLMSDFNAVAVYVYRAWTPADLESVLDSRGTVDALDAQLRREEVASVASQYLEKIEFYDHVVLNVGGQTNMIEQLSKILLSYGISPDSVRDGVAATF